MAPNNLATSHGQGSITTRSAMSTSSWPHMIGDKRFAISSLSALSRRNVDGSDKMVNLMIVLLVLVFVSLVLASGLYLLVRRRRIHRQRNAALPTYETVDQSQNSRGLTIDTKSRGRSSILYIGRDGQPMLQNPNSPPHSPDNVPQIHITFPDDQDENGRRQSGRVLVVRVGDNATVGLEPMQEEQLPAYEKEAKGQFQSIDMDQIGGLKEKDKMLSQ